MRLLTYQMPDELLAIANAGEFNEFDLNEFFSASGADKTAVFKHKNDVQKWLKIIQGTYEPRRDNLVMPGGCRNNPADYRRRTCLRHSSLELSCAVFSTAQQKVSTRVGSQ